MSRIVTTSLSCGATLVVEPIENVASAAMTWLLPAGSASDHPDGDGVAALLSELLFRGAGGLSSRDHSDALDRLGVSRHSHVSRHNLALVASLQGARLPEALPLLTALVRSPALPDAALEPVRSLSLQSLEALEDDPQHLVMLRLREHHVAPPFNRHGYGDADVLARATIDDVRAAWRDRFVPAGSIIAIAGAIDPDAVARQMEELLDGWSGTTAPPVETAAPARGMHHVPDDTSQVHLGVAWDAPTEADEDAMLERLAVRLLSGGTSCRLFTEVRQKRSLCYSVGASYSAGRDRGVVELYAGTTPERAQQTLDVCLAEVARLARGADAAEFARDVTGMKSSLVMGGESTAARAGALARDHFRLGRARSLEEVAEAVDAITLDQLNAYLAARSFGDLTVCTIGPAALRMPEAAPVAG